MIKQKVLFICVHNSARSQMAEAFLKQFAGDKFEVESAGLEPGTLNPLAVEVMKEAGIDIYRQGREYDYVITVCDESQSARCPVFPGGGRRLHWGFDDPSGFAGSPQEKLEKTRAVRELIKKEIQKFLSSFSGTISR